MVTRHRSDHSVRFISVGPLWCMPETNLLLYVNCALIKNRRDRQSRFLHSGGLSCCPWLYFRWHRLGSAACEWTPPVAGATKSHLQCTCPVLFTGTSRALCVHLEVKLDTFFPCVAHRGPRWYGSPVLSSSPSNSTHRVCSAPLLWARMR